MRARGQSCNLSLTGSQVFWPAVYSVPGLREPRLGTNKSLAKANGKESNMGLPNEKRGDDYAMTRILIPNLILLIYESAIPSDDMTSKRSPFLHLIPLSLHFQENGIEERESPASILWTISPKGLINPSPSNFPSTLVSAYVVDCCGTAVLNCMESYFTLSQSSQSCLCVHTLILSSLSCIVQLCQKVEG